MKILMFEKRFWEAIVTGHKVHSIRRTRKRPIYPGDELSLRAWEGKAYRSKQRILCEETCLFVRECWIDGQGIVIDGHRFSEPEELDAFAVSDGFDNWKQMQTYQDWFNHLPFSGDLIQWGIHPLLANVRR